MEKDEGTSDQPHKLQNSRPVRERVLTAAFGLFCDRGFAAATMLDIATRAHISKRDLYALFENKYALVAQCVEERAQAMHRSLDPAITVPKS